MTFRTSVFSISDGLSASLLNISSEGVVLGRGRLIAPSASLGEVSSSVFPLERTSGCGSGVTSWQGEVKGWKVAHTGVTHRVIYIFVTNPCFQTSELAFSDFDSFPCSGRLRCLVPRVSTSPPLVETSPLPPTATLDCTQIRAR